MLPADAGPLYPKLGTSVAKFRKIKSPTAAQRQAHGDAVHAAMLALQRRALQRELPSIAPSCASRTWHADGDAIHKAVRQQQHRELMSWPDRIRRARTAQEWQRLYDEAMRTKRAARSSYRNAA